MKFVKKLFVKKNIIYILIAIFIFAIGVGLTLFLIDKNHNNQSSKNNKKDIISEEQNEVSNESDNPDLSKQEIESTKETTSEKKLIKTSNNKNTSPNTSNNNQIKKSSKQNKTTIAATITYYCAEGFTLNGTKCTSTSSYNASVNYSCTSGTLQGSNCVIPTNIYIYYTTASTQYCTGFSGSSYYNTCRCQQSGGEFVENGNCYKSGYKSVPADATYSCGNGFEMVGSKCVAYTTMDAFYKYECPSGYELNGSQCEK